MPLHPLPFHLKAVRVISMALPPAGLLLLWLSPVIQWYCKVLSTVYLPLYTTLYVSALLATLYFGFGIDIEWRGGPGPVITFSKTVSNYQTRIEPCPLEQACSFNGSGRQERILDGISRPQSRRHLVVRNLAEMACFDIAAAPAAGNQPLTSSTAR